MNAILVVLTVFGLVAQPTVQTTCGYRTVCDPYGPLPCCNNNLCAHPTTKDCNCSTCIDYRQGNPPVRLVGGSRYSGRVELNVDSEWGTVCSHLWTLAEGNIVCRELGYPGAESVEKYGFYGEGTGPIYHIFCQDIFTTESPPPCLLSDAIPSLCTHGYDAGVTCTPVIRLAEGASNHLGRVEVNIEGQWGTVCDHGFGMNEANVICRQLGFFGADISATEAAHYGQGSGPIHMAEVSCDGTESNLLKCDYVVGGIRGNDCQHSDDVGVVCSLAPVVRLAGWYEHAGRVEVFKDGSWGTICREMFDIDDANVVCRQLGYSGAEYVFGERNIRIYGEGTGAIHLDRLECAGTESSILDCPSLVSPAITCGHILDVGVSCALFP